MEVKQGYKQTEVGVIPADWNVSTVGAEFSIQLGKMLDAEKNMGVPKPFLGNRAIQWGRIDLTDIGEVKMTSFDLQRFRLREGDLLVCEGGEVGRAAIWHQLLEECYYQKALHRLRPIRGYNVKLMLNMLQRVASTGFLQNFVTQTSIAHLPKDKFETVPIPLPPTKAEQEAIAEALSDADALIESLEQLLVKKRHLKQGAMQELLTGKKRLPGFSGKWEAKRLGDILTICHGKSQREVEAANGPYPILASGGEIGRANHFLYDKPSVLIGRKGTIDQPQYMDAPFWTVDTLFYSVVHEPHHAKFIFYRFCLIDWNQHNEASGVPSLNARTIEKIVIACPRSDEQTAIATVLSDMDAELVALETKLTKARQLKQGMMQELLTGRIRLV
jgi:type I restriction enzyme, S subunit